MTLAHEIPARSIVIFLPPITRRHHYRRPDPQHYYSNRAHRSPVVHTSFQRGQPPPAIETLMPPQDFALLTLFRTKLNAHLLVVARFVRTSRTNLKRFSGYADFLTKVPHVVHVVVRPRYEKNCARDVCRRKSSVYESAGRPSARRAKERNKERPEKKNTRAPPAAHYFR